MEKPGQNIRYSINLSPNLSDITFDSLSQAISALDGEGPTLDNKGRGYITLPEGLAEFTIESLNEAITQLGGRIILDEVATSPKKSQSAKRKQKKEKPKEVPATTIKVYKDQGILEFTSTDDESLSRSEIHSFLGSTVANNAVAGVEHTLNLFSVSETVSEDKESEYALKHPLRRMAAEYCDDSYVRSEIDKFKVNRGIVFADPSTELLKKYLQEVTQFELLTADDEVNIMRQVIRGVDAYQKLETDLDSSSDISQLRQEVKNGVVARQIMILANTRLVVSIARKVGRASKYDLLDRIQSGNLGLIRAIDKFDPEMGIKFSTYATWWIKQSISRAINDYGHTIRFPYRVSQNIGTINTTRDRLRVELCREPTSEDISKGLFGVLAPREIEDTLALSDLEPFSLDHVLTNDYRKDPSSRSFWPVRKSREFSTTILNRQENSKWIDEISNKAIVGQIINLLPTRRDKLIMSLRFGVEVEEFVGSNVNLPGNKKVGYDDLLAIVRVGDKGLSLEQVGSILGLTRERIRQLQVDFMEIVDQHRKEDWATYKDTN